jgi:hypothetical protein
MNKSSYRLALAMGAALAAVACANTGGAIAEKEDMLLSAGFVSKKADATAQMAGPQIAAATSIRGEKPKRQNTVFIRGSDGVRLYLCRRSAGIRPVPAANGGAANRDRRADPRHFEHRAVAWRRGASLATRQRRQATSRRGERVYLPARKA